VTMIVPPQRQHPARSQRPALPTPAPGGPPPPADTVDIDTTDIDTTDIDTAGTDTTGVDTDDPRGRTDELVARGLADYVQAVADALHVGAEAVDSEVTDTVTGYIALGARSPAWPNRDLMLVWNERVGWVLAVETPPAEPAVVLAYLGAERVAEPSVVARFVDNTLAGRPAGRDRPPVPATAGREELGAELARYSAARH
jgi:Family of unknown function (DUF6292)